MHNTAKTNILILPALIVITPFLVFLNYNSYCLACAETWMALGGLIALAMICSIIMLLGGWRVRGLVMAVLIIFFIDLPFTPWNLIDWTTILLFAGMQTFVLCLFLKEKFYTIATAIFLTYFVVTVFQLSLAATKSNGLFEHVSPQIHSPPRIIHLILDEHIGIEGIPTDIEGSAATKNLITRFYLKNGFQLSGGAYSRYFYTHASIGHMLNFAAESHTAALMSGPGPYDLLRNEYFKLLSDKKYHIEVLSPGWIDFCSDPTVVSTACIEKHWGILKNFAKLDLPVSQKLQVLYSRYFIQSSIVAATIYVVVLPLQPKFSAFSQWVWAFHPDRARTDSLNALADLKVLWSNILSLPHATVLFAHLLIPHHPYVAHSDCSIRSSNRDFLWNYRGLFDPPPTNTAASRKERYQQYFQQLECLYLRLDELFDRMRAAGIYDDSIIVLHGDHGSRIVMTEPTAENQHALTKRDLVDGFSTLFAMKLPDKPGAYDKSPWPLEQLFAKFAFEAGLAPTNILPEKSEPYIYLTGGSDKEFVRIPYVPPN
ncbi:MAG TPA: hypothetical protein VEG60_34470 [Candidatus Binatia bacterium]|nr:hypothetical protein [Candidatus Binatia bacterium]